MNITVYTSQSCIWCVRAKELLAAKGYTFSEVNLSKVENRTPDHLREFNRVTNRARTVPQIIVDGVCIGGYEGLVEQIKSGELYNKVSNEG